MAKKKNTRFSLKKMMDYLLDLRWFDPEDPILYGNYQPGKRGTKLLVCTGSNATGKSFFGRLVSAYCKVPKGLNGDAECLRVGMEIRASEGLHRAFVLVSKTHRNR